VTVVHGPPAPAAVEVEPASRAARDLLITHATVMTAAKGTIAGRSILVRGGRIAAVGKDVKAPPAPP
jgi:imidazolonepropionase-like amidohydrolase